MKNIVFLFTGILIAFFVYFFWYVTNYEKKEISNKPSSTSIATKEKSITLISKETIDSNKIVNKKILKTDSPLIGKVDINLTTSIKDDTYNNVEEITNSKLNESEFLSTSQIKKNLLLYQNIHLNSNVLLSKAGYCDTTSFAIAYNTFTISYIYILDNLSHCTTSTEIRIKEIYAIYKNEIVFFVSLDDILNKNITKFKFDFFGERGKEIKFLFIGEDDTLLTDSAIIR